MPGLTVQLRPGTVPCGSEPAREEALTVDIDGECQTAFASRLAPTLTE